MLVSKRDYLSRLHTLSVFVILNGTGKTKLAILALLYCREMVKNSNNWDLKAKMKEYFSH